MAELADVSAMTVTRFENGKTGGAIDSQKKVRRALEKAGVEFIEENGGGAGVRLKKRSRSKSLRADQLNAENDG